MTNGFLDGLKESLNVTETENGAVALKSTLSKCVDAFGLLGSMKDSSESQIVKVFSAAFNEDSKTAIKMLFYIRDIRGGQGARRVFRIHSPLSPGCYSSPRVTARLHLTEW